jgi:hypothetical protein
LTFNWSPKRIKKLYDQKVRMKENKVQNNCINNLEDMQPQLVVVVQG